MDSKIVNEWEFYVEVGGVAAAYLKDHPSNCELLLWECRNIFYLFLRLFSS